MGMRPILLAACGLWLHHVVLAHGTSVSTPPAPLTDGCYGRNVTYSGLHLDGVEAFLGIRFAEDTAGQNRFRPPIPFTPAANSLIAADTPGPACPQQVDPSSTTQPPPEFEFASSFITEISEDCLRLNVWRPSGTKADARLPVLVWIYGGGFTGGFKDDIISHPGGLILQSVANGLPIIHVELNYRLGVFGFAQSQALEDQGSENAGLRDQRLAIEWVHDNIRSFGGDPEKITIHGQSSGGLAVGMQVMAYGASRGFPFQQAICESQALEPGITGNFTRTAMARAVAATKCNTTELDSPSTAACLRGLPMHALLHAQLSTGSEAPSANIGDEWLPVVDGPNGFLPDAPSTLIYQARFANVTTMIGWCENDGVYFTPPDTNTAHETYTFVRQYLPGMTDANVNELLSLYPVTDFEASHFPNGTVQLSAEQYRAGRILRDILFTCQPIFYGAALAKAGNSVYLYNQNQTMLTPILHFYGDYGYGVIHTSELGFVFGNLSHFHQYDWPYHPTASDFALRNSESRSWSTFTATGRPSLGGHDTLQGWREAQFDDENYGLFVIGGPNQGYAGSGENVAKAREAISKEALVKRCSFLNSPEIVKQLHY